MSKTEAGLMPQAPSRSFRQNSSLPLPMGLMIPKPVITTRFSGIYDSYAICALKGNINNYYISNQGLSQGDLI
jgi:hypothetical protein